MQVCERGEISCMLSGYLHEPQRLAHELGTDTDELTNPELVLMAYARFGTAALSKLRGSFCLVLWNEDRREGLITCDPLATQQLYLRRGPGALLFASELHQLLALIPSRPGPDSVALVRWLAGGRYSTDQTFYEGVSRLRAGELIELRQGSAELRTYWSPRYAGTMKATRAEFVEGLRCELEQATGKRLSSQSNGVVLSGGLDSSIVTACAMQTKEPNSELRTFSTVFPGASYDESSKIFSLTAHLGLEPTAFRPAPQGALWRALQHTKRWEVPLTFASAVIDFGMVEEAARVGAEVVLDGQAGDEVLGLSSYLIADRLLRGRLIEAIRLTARWPVGYPPSRRQRLWGLTHFGLHVARPHRLERAVRNRLRPEPREPRWLLPPHRRVHYALHDEWAWKASARGPYWWRYLADLLIAGPHRDLRPELLRHRAASVGVRNESPMYDIDLIEYILRLPPELAFDHNFTRPLARETMRGLLPEDVRQQRQKAIFSDFCLDMLTGPDSQGIGRLLCAADAELGAYVDMEAVRDLWHRERPAAGKSSTNWGTTVWRLAAAEVWLRFQADREFPDTMLARPDIPAPSLERVRLAAPGTFFPLVQANSAA